MAINDFMMHAPMRLHYGATLHPDKLPGWAFFQVYEACRKSYPPMETHASTKKDWAKHVWPMHRDGGTSGLFGVTIGLLMGYDQIILAGVPCDASRRYFDPPGHKHPQFGTDSTFKEWKEANKYIFQGKVKSLSGRTRDLLGEP
jgi:hypothetical protein